MSKDEVNISIIPEILKIERLNYGLSALDLQLWSPQDKNQKEQTAKYLNKKITGFHDSNFANWPFIINGMYSVPVNFSSYKRRKYPYKQRLSKCSYSSKVSFQLFQLPYRNKMGRFCKTSHQSILYVKYGISGLLKV